MHKEVLGLLAVLLGVGCVSAQQLPAGYVPYGYYPPYPSFAPPGYYQGYPQAQPVAPGWDPRVPIIPYPAPQVPYPAAPAGRGLAYGMGPNAPAARPASTRKMPVASDTEPSDSVVRTSAVSTPQGSEKVLHAGGVKTMKAVGSGKEIKQVSHTAPAGHVAPVGYEVVDDGYGNAFGGCPESVCLPPVPFSVQAATVDDGPHVPPGACDCKLWFDAGYRLSWFKPANQPLPLVSTGSGASTSPGSLNQQDTAVIFGRQNLDFNLMQGVDTTVGLFLDPEHHFSVDLSGLYYFSGNIHAPFISDSTGNPVIARPVINGSTGMEESFLSSLPGSVRGSTIIDASTHLVGFEADGRCHAQCDEYQHVDLLGGFRFLRLSEKLSIKDSIVPLQDNFLTFRGFPLLTTSSLFDEDLFGTANEFYGLNLGMRYTFRHDWVSLSMFGKAAVGITDEKVQIRGQTTMFSPTGFDMAQGGVLALPSNIGNYHRSVFAVIPEGGINLGIEPCKHVRVTAGYSFLYWNRVTRPGDQLDRVINPALVPTDQQFGLVNNGGNHPQFTWKDEVFWIHTMNFGLEFYY